MRKFGMRFRAANAAKIKYNDVDYDSKRVWVSRLLSQFMMAGVLILSIDESSFKQEGLPRRYWQVNSSTVKQLYHRAALRSPE